MKEIVWRIAIYKGKSRIWGEPINLQSSLFTAAVVLSSVNSSVCLAKFIHIYSFSFHGFSYCLLWDCHFNYMLHILGSLVIPIFPIFSQSGNKISKRQLEEIRFIMPLTLTLTMIDDNDVYMHTNTQ